MWAVAVVRIGVGNESLCTVGGKFCDCVCAIDRLCNAWSYCTLSVYTKKRMSKISSASRMINRTMKNYK